MNPKALQTVAITALLSSGLCLLVFGLQLGFLFMFLPTLPLFSTGLTQNPRMVAYASAVALLPITLLADAATSIFFIFAFAGPCWYFCYTARKSRTLTFSEMPGTHLRIWFPIGITITHLAVYACALLALTTAFYAMQPTNLPQLITQDVAEELSKLEKLYDAPLIISASQISFLICALTTWMWASMLWMHAWAANRALLKRKIARRPNMAVTPFPIPNWLLSLLGICALAALIGGESMQFLGRACVIMLLLPYAFQGAALLHFGTLAWPNRRFFLFFTYLSIAMFIWPVLFLSAVGLGHHLKILNKHLSAGGTSSK